MVRLLLICMQIVVYNMYASGDVKSTASIKPIPKPRSLEELGRSAGLVDAVLQQELKEGESLSTVVFPEDFCRKFDITPDDIKLWSEMVQALERSKDYENFTEWFFKRFIHIWTLPTWLTLYYMADRGGAEGLQDALIEILPLVLVRSIQQTKVDVLQEISHYFKKIEYHGVQNLFAALRKKYKSLLTYMLTDRDMHTVALSDGVTPCALEWGWQGNMGKKLTILTNGQKEYEIKDKAAETLGITMTEQPLPLGKKWNPQRIVPFAACGVFATLIDGSIEVWQKEDSGWVEKFKTNPYDVTPMLAWYPQALQVVAAFNNDGRKNLLFIDFDTSVGSGGVRCSFHEPGKDDVQRVQYEDNAGNIAQVICCPTALREIVLRCHNGLVHVYPEKQQLRIKYLTKEPFLDCAWHSSGNYIAALKGSSLEIWKRPQDLSQQWHLVANVKIASDALRLAWGPDNRLVVCHKGGKVTGYEMECLEKSCKVTTLFQINGNITGQSISVDMQGDCIALLPVQAARQGIAIVPLYGKPSLEQYFALIAVQELGRQKLTTEQRTLYEKLFKSLFDMYPCAKNLIG